LSGIGKWAAPLFSDEISAYGRDGDDTGLSLMNRFHRLSDRLRSTLPRRFCCTAGFLYNADSLLLIF
jgi:hypothetical protein